MQLNENLATVEFDEESGEYVLVFPPHLLEELQWKENDNLVWKFDTSIDSWTISKVEP